MQESGRPALSRMTGHRWWWIRGVWLREHAGWRRSSMARGAARAKSSRAVRSPPERYRAPRRHGRPPPPGDRTPTGPLRLVDPHKRSFAGAFGHGHSSAATFSPGGPLTPGTGDGGAHRVRDRHLRSLRPSPRPRRGSSPAPSSVRRSASWKAAAAHWRSKAIEGSCAGAGSAAFNSSGLSGTNVCRPAASR